MCQCHFEQAPIMHDTVEFEWLALSVAERVLMGTSWSCDWMKKSKFFQENRHLWGVLTSIRGTNFPNYEFVAIWRHHQLSDFRPIGDVHPEPAFWFCPKCGSFSLLFSVSFAKNQLKERQSGGQPLNISLNRWTPPTACSKGHAPFTATFTHHGLDIQALGKTM